MGEWRKLDQCRLNLKNLALSLELYQTEHNGTLPTNLRELDGYLLYQPTCPTDPLGLGYQDAYKVDNGRFSLYCSHGNHLAAGLPQGFPGFSSQSGLLFPSGYQFGDPGTDRKYHSECIENLKNIGTALEMYSSDNHGKYPSNPLLLVPGYLKTIPHCPSSGAGDYQFRLSPANFTVTCVSASHRLDNAPVSPPRYSSEKGLESATTGPGDPKNMHPQAASKWCQSNLKRIATALEMYATDNAGRYPQSLTQISPQYLELPQCPAASSDTYKAGYKVGPGDKFQVCCLGESHNRAGVIPDHPSFDSEAGLDSGDFFEEASRQYATATEDRALSIALAALALAKKIGFEEQIGIWSANAASQLAAAFQLEEAKTVQVEGLGLCQRLLGCDSIATLQCQLKMSAIANLSGDKQASLNWLHRSQWLAHRIDGNGQESEASLAVSAAEGQLAYQSDDHNLARTSWLRALDIATRLQNRPLVLELKLDLARVEDDSAAEARLLEVNQQAGAIGDEGQRTQTSALFALSVLYQRTGRAALALTTLRQAKEACLATLGSGHMLTWSCGWMLGDQLMQMGQIEDAQKELLATLAAVPAESKSAKLASLRSFALNDLALCQCIASQLQGDDLSLARKSIDQALALCPIEAKPILLMTDAEIRYQEQDLGGSERVLRSVLEHAEPDSGLKQLATLGLTRTLRASGRAREALLCLDQIGTPPGLASLERAYLAFMSRDQTSFRNQCSAVQSATEEELSEVLHWGSENDRLRFLALTNSTDLLGTLGDPTLIARARVHDRGLVLDSLLAEKKNRSTSFRTLQEQWSELRRRRGQVAPRWRDFQRLTDRNPLLLGAKEVRRTLDEKISIDRELVNVEKSLRSIQEGVSEKAMLSPRLEAVQSLLPARHCLVDYVRYRHYLGADKWEPRYGALVIKQAQQPVWIPLGSAAEIDQLVMAFRRGLQTGSKSAVEVSLRGLFQSLWKPLQPAISTDCQEAEVLPEGSLQHLSFATLLNERGRFLGERLRVRYLSSYRDLLRPSAGRPQKTCEIFADPTYGSGVTTFARLPGTRMEAQQVMAASKGLRLRPIPHLGLEANEARLSAVQAPEILHIATHGFVTDSSQGFGRGAARLDAPNLSPTLTNLRPLPANPMVRSGLALTGASSVAWGQDGTLPVSPNDGIVTAQEFSRLNLKGTRLVTLSACDTGLGSIVMGEGVLGLRRAACESGAAHVLVTLWPVNDLQTAEFMRDFYHQLATRPDPGQALNLVQSAWLKRLREKNELFQAVNVAGPFVLTSHVSPSVW